MTTIPSLGSSELLKPAPDDPGQPEVASLGSPGPIAAAAGGPGQPKVPVGNGRGGRGVRRTRGERPRWVRLAVRLLSVVAGLGLWELLSATRTVDPLFLPRFSTTIHQLWTDVSSGSLNQDLVATAIPFAVGLVICLVVGSALGLAMGLSRTMEDIASPWVLGLNSVPRIAFIPVAIVAFGIATKAHIAVVVATGIFPMIINTHTGVRNVAPELLEMGSSFRAGRLLTIRRVVIPAAAPFLVSGFRMSVALALVGEVVAEFFSATCGIGYRLNHASQIYDIVEVYAMMITLAVIGILLASLVRIMEKRIERWHGTSR